METTLCLILSYVGKYIANLETSHKMLLKSQPVLLQPCILEVYTLVHFIKFNLEYLSLDCCYGSMDTATNEDGTQPAYHCQAHSCDSVLQQYFNLMVLRDNTVIRQH